MSHLFVCLLVAVTSHNRLMWSFSALLKFSRGKLSPHEKYLLTDLEMAQLKNKLFRIY